MNKRKPLTRGQWIAIGAIIVPAVLAIIGWFIVSPPKATQSNSFAGNGSSVENSVSGGQTIVGSNNTVVQSVIAAPLPAASAHQSASPPKKKGQTGARVESAPSPASPVANAPNGIAISGGTVTNPTVNNFGPPVLPPAAIHICASKSTPDNTGAIYQVFTLTTDSRVEAPRYEFWFDDVLPKGTSASSPDMAMNVRETQSDSRYAFQIFQTWYPGQRINVVLMSSIPIRLTKELGEHRESFTLSSADCKSGL
jgi:hypothetical protein